MKKQFLLSTAAACLLSATILAGCNPKTPAITLPAGVSHLETVSAKGKDIVIPYSKYVLDNGLTVILHADASDPLVHVDVTYHVGSGREEAGRSGFAHFFEHMMFQGSENVAKGEHFGVVTESGGTLNGTTNTDRTNYFETVPSNQLERMLWLESDRMGHFLGAVTEEKFENQRETVKNERGQNYDNRPYGLLRERVNEALYPAGHPYSWLTIGYIEDLNRADLNDLKKFFLRWYGPNNATLTIGGDLDAEQTLAWVNQYFGSIPKGPDVEKPIYETVTLDEDRYISMEDNVSLPLMQISFPTVHVYHPDEAPLDVLMSILGDGKTSLLYKNMVKDGKAVQANAGHGCGELSCVFTVLALPVPGTSLAELETIARASLEEFEARGGAKDDDITRVKAGIVSGMVFGLESVRGKVSQLASYETFQNNPNAIHSDIARYEGVTKEDVMRVYKKYIKGQHSVVISVVPKGKGDQIIKPDTWVRPERNFEKQTDMAGLELRPAIENFDRSVKPNPGPNPSIKVPPIYNNTLANGVNILGAVNNEVPTTTIRLRIPAGQTREDLSQSGIASLAADLMNEGTENMSAIDISNALQKMGSSINFSAGEKYSTMNIRSLTKNLDETLDIALDKLTNAKFTAEDYTRLHKQHMEGIKLSKKNASATASNAFAGLLLGQDNNFGVPNAGFTETAKTLTLADAQAFKSSAYGPKGADIIVVSNLSQSAINGKLAKFGTWSGGNIDAKAVKTFPKLAAGTLYLIDKPEAAQSEIRIGKRALNFDTNGEYYRAGLMNYVLGGSFNSRINMNLREDKGYTYGARSSFYGNDIYGRYSASAGVRTDTTKASIIEFVKEINAYQATGMTDKEVEFMKSSLGQRDARAYETPRQKLGFLSRIATYKLDPKFIDEQNEILKTISKEQMNALASKHLNMDEMILLVVGDKKVIEKDLQSLGYPIVELDTDGRLLK